MLDAAEAARRRELHQRVYAPGGLLTDAETAELHDLDNRHLAGPAAPAKLPVRGAQHAASATGDAAIREPRAESADAGATPAADAGATPTADAGATPAADAGAPRRRWLLPVVAAVAVLVGLGAGWLLFAPGTHRATMTAEQQDVWGGMEASGDYDPGSIHVVGEKYGATTWLATQDNAERTCIILTRKDLEPAAGCRPTDGDYEAFDLQANLDYTEDGDQYMIWATLFEDAGGNPVTVIRQQNLMDDGWDWRSQYSEEELAMVSVLEGAGFEGEALGVIGHDGTTPVWLYQHDKTCLIVVQNGTDVALECGTLSTDPDLPLQLEVGDVVYSLVDNSSRGPSLTVIRTSVPTQVICDAETGQCTSIDDTIGEIG